MMNEKLNQKLSKNLFKILIKPEKFYYKNYKKNKSTCFVYLFLITIKNN